ADLVAPRPRAEVRPGEPDHERDREAGAEQERRQRDQRRSVESSAVHLRGPPSAQLDPAVRPGSATAPPAVLVPARRRPRGRTLSASYNLTTEIVCWKNFWTASSQGTTAASTRASRGVAGRS